MKTFAEIKDALRRNECVVFTIPNHPPSRVYFLEGIFLSTYDSAQERVNVSWTNSHGGSEITSYALEAVEKFFADKAWQLVEKTPEILLEQLARDVIKAEVELIQITKQVQETATLLRTLEEKKELLRSKKQAAIDKLLVYRD